VAECLTELGPSPSQQLLGLITKHQTIKQKIRKPAAGPRIEIRNYSDPDQRQAFYRIEPTIGTLDFIVHCQLIRQYRDAPIQHPYVQGHIAYSRGKLEEENPYNRSTDKNKWYLWFTGYHAVRREREGEE